MQTNQRSHRLCGLVTGKPVILPSLLQCDFGNLQSEIERLEEIGVRGFHLDVMDGHFVPNLTYGMPIVAAVRRLTKLPLDVHLMISNPGKYLREFADAGADCLTVHAEIEADCCHLLGQIRDLGMASGLAVNPGTEIAEVSKCLDCCDLLLIMSVDAGFGGQSFNPVALEKLQRVRITHPDLILEIDGGINQHTIGKSVLAGAQLLVVGSAIFQQEDYQQAIGRLVEAMER